MAVNCDALTWVAPTPRRLATEDETEAAGVSSTLRAKYFLCSRVDSAIRGPHCLQNRSPLSECVVVAVLRREAS